LVEEVLKWLSQKHLGISAEKCTSRKQSVEYLGCYNTLESGNGKQQSQNNSIVVDSTIIERCAIVFRLRQFVQEVYT
jgi:hypothetical protein